MGDGKAAEIVKKAMESGCIKQRNTVAIVTGIMGAGKSTFLKRLFRQDIPSSYASTGVVGDSYRGVMCHLGSLRSLEYVPRGRILKLLAPLIKLGIPEGDVEAVAQSFMDALAVSTPRASSTPVVTITTKPTYSQASTTEPTYSQDALQGLLKEESEESADCLELDLIHVLDTGGQPECMEVMPTLIHNSNLMILVLDLARGLECCTTPFCAEEGKQYDKSTLLQRPNKHIIHQLIRTMQAKRVRSNYKGKSSSCHSRFLVVGTHRDCIQPPEHYQNVLDSCSKELKKLFGQVVEDEQILYKGGLIFPLNLQVPEHDDEKVLSEIRGDLRLPDVKQFDLPLSFFMFEQDAYKYVEEKARAVKVLSLKECVEIGARLKMSRETVQAALHYLYKHNVFLYFQDILPDLVFLDPQEPLELVNAIVRLSYKVKAKSNEVQCLTGRMQRCLSEGLITEELLKHNDLSLHFVSDLYQPCDAIILFQKIYTIAPLGEAKREKEYVMMCLLPDKTKDEIRSLLPSSPWVIPLLVHFENDCAPIGCFGNCISCLIMKYGWDLLRTLERKPQCLAHNVVQFSGTPTVPMEITLVSCTGYFEVHVNPKNSQEEKHCPEIHLNVVSAVEHVLKKMHYDISIKPAFLCQCTNTPRNLTQPPAATEPHTAIEPHAAIVIPLHPTSSSTSSSTITPATIKCTITNKHYDLNNEQRMWIEKGNDQTESKYNATVPLVGKSNNFTTGMDGCPTLIEFMKFGEHHVNIIEKIGATYHNFGTLLLEDTDGSIMGALEGEKRGNAEDINNAVLTRWIRGKGRKPTSWATLATVLGECKLTTLAGVIHSVKATPSSS